MDICYQPIGYLYTAFQESDGWPGVTAETAGKSGRIDLEPQWAVEIRDLKDFSHIFVLYHQHLAQEYPRPGESFLQAGSPGPYATRGLIRPDAIGLVVLQLTAIEEARLWVADVRIPNGSAILDIRPYVPPGDARPAVNNRLIH